jgi:hypothetical protein
MLIRFPKIPGVEFVRGAHEPRVVAIVPATIVHFALLCCWTWSVFVFQPCGHRQWALITIALVQVWLVAGRRPNLTLATVPPTALERVFGHSLGLGRSVLAGVLTCSLGLIVSSALCSGGAMPPAKSDPDAIRVLTWNILHLTEHGMPWSRYLLGLLTVTRQRPCSSPVISTPLPIRRIAGSARRPTSSRAGSSWARRPARQPIRFTVFASGALTTSSSIGARVYWTDTYEAIGENSLVLLL